MSDISSADYLPTFGPSFINFYGAHDTDTDAEPDIDSSKDYNEGLNEGMVYKGRMMMEMQMSLDVSRFGSKVKEITISDQNRVKKFLKRRDYKLFAVFFSASNISPHDKPVQFEVSVGNYGNKMDDYSSIQLSSTPPINPIYDGNNGYYLPWSEKKPCVQIDCKWEDCLYRIEALNSLLYIVNYLTEGINSLNDILEKEADIVRSKITEILDDLKFYQHKILTPLPDQSITQLDKLVWKRRKKEWRQIQEECDNLLKNVADLNVTEHLSSLESILLRLKSLAKEPQSSIPDIVIWMLSKGQCVAVARIPSHEVMYSLSPRERGKQCGKPQLLFMAPPTARKEQECHAQVQVMLWMGLEKDQSAWREYFPEGQVEHFAEIYENETRSSNGWSDTNFTDCSGKLKQTKEIFQISSGWDWEGDWFLLPMAKNDLDDGFMEWREDIFEYQHRSHMQYWPEVSEWASKDGERTDTTVDAIECPEGWVWANKWAPSIANKVVDEKGWEYAVDGHSETADWVPYEKRNHLTRRRQWTRKRVRNTSAKVIERKQIKRRRQTWEYARLAHQTYHFTEHYLDKARRKRWGRQLVAVGDSEEAERPLFNIQERKDSGEYISRQQVPQMYLTFKNYHTFELRAYIYQAQGMHFTGIAEMSQLFGVVSFNNHTICTHSVGENLYPTWNETAIINDIEMFQNPHTIADFPPSVVVEIFGKDSLDQEIIHSLGTCKATPTVQLNSEDPSSICLHKFELTCHGKHAGLLLAAFELILYEGKEMPFLPPKASPPHNYYIVPSHLSPITEKLRIEILCWGVRDLMPYQKQPITSPQIQIECGGEIAKSAIIKRVKENPNFPRPVIHFDVYYPRDKAIAPPLNIQLLEYRGQGHRPLIVGTHVITPLDSLIVDPKLSPPVESIKKAIASDYHVSNQDGNELEEVFGDDPDDTFDIRFDWWSKYYCSFRDAECSEKDYIYEGHNLLRIYTSELEDAFNGFSDVAQIFPLHQMREQHSEEEVVEYSNKPVGLFKGSVKVYPLPCDSPPPELIFSNILSGGVVDVVVRVYVIKGIDLQPQNLVGKCDPYLKVGLGKMIMDDRDNYVSANLNPTFGRMYEFAARLPIDSTLKVSVMYWNRFAANDLVGETEIDLENRYISSYRATCGLPETICKSGPNKWRDSKLPVTILDEWLSNKNLPMAEWDPSGTSVKVDGMEYSLDMFEHHSYSNHHLSNSPKQRLALHILRQQNLVPEHIETRSLYNPLLPGVSQGKLHMWVDIFNREFNIPEPVDVSPRTPEKYVLRLVVYQTKDVLMDETSVATGESFTDLYVKGWIRGDTESQKTDVHYRAFEGEAFFNWRMVFPFEYLKIENMIVTKKKYSDQGQGERHVPPTVTLQIWDNDLYCRDDFMGIVVFNLSALPLPVADAKLCNMNQLPSEDRSVLTENLFKKKRTKGWWPCYQMDDDGSKYLAGKVYLELELLTEKEAELRPAGKGRDKPNSNPSLSPPK